MVSRATRQRSGSCSKSVKFVEIPTVHYANIDWDWVIPDEEDSDVDTESEPEDEDEGSLPPSGVRTTGSSSGEKPSSLKKLVSLKRDTSLSSRKRTTETLQSSKKRPSISGPFALGTLPIPPPPAPSPPFVVSHPAKGTSVSLRSAPSMDSFRSVKSSGGRSILSVKSLRSLPGSLKTGAQGLKDWFKGRRVIVD
ncbi:hypothetical protein CPB85DRAFT_1427498 [Mucidula mucida]|nr:hypothetical protein CPB85DRAFT_1427498 [Mucidula mucida]